MFARPCLCFAGMITLLIATRNAHKVQEIRAILGEKFHYLTLDDVPNPPEVIEDAGTFAGNASKKAVALANCLGEAHALKRMIGGIKAAMRQDRLYVLAECAAGRTGLAQADLSLERLTDLAAAINR